MTIKVKICGLSTVQSVRAATEAGASHLGFVFFEKSPRNVTPEKVAELAADIPSSILKTGVFVNPDNQQLQRILNIAPLNLIQLHGNESPERVQEIKKYFGLPVMKAIAISDTNDIALAKTYENSADMLLFDAKPTASLKDALPGGNGLSFDWQLIKGTDWQIPWMLSGGLDALNIRQAITISGAEIVDISSGIENQPGEKSIAKIKAFISKVKNI
ncbi:MAG: phosphoribosylanthranilate isomerase [Emcibacter sp.]|nr:phosphoribosylanthranilate isomerase [Emcibacter sp.]